MDFNCLLNIIKYIWIIYQLYFGLAIELIQLCLHLWAPRGFFPLSFLYCLRKNFLKYIWSQINSYAFVEAVWRKMQNCKWKIPGWLFSNQAERLNTTFSDFSDLVLIYLEFLEKLTFESDFLDLIKYPRTTGRPEEC